MTNGTASETNGIPRGTNGNDLLECPHCGSVAEYVSEHAKGKRWAVACTMTSKVAADDGRPMCRCRTPFVRDKGQARDIWNRRAAITDYYFAMAVHDGNLWSKCSECKERQGYYLDAETIQRQQERIAKLTIERDAYFEMVKRVQADCDARDELISDMARELRGLNDGGVPTDCMEYERRMRELGIEADA